MKTLYFLRELLYSYPDIIILSLLTFGAIIYIISDYMKDSDSHYD